jgi:hypothetical protein
MNRITLILILLIALGVPVLSAGEGALEDPREPDRIPVSRVTLYTAGLAWMIHEIIYFSVEQNDINDILKSLVVEDLGGGTVDSINFDSENPLAVALSDLRVNPSGSPALVDFLKRTQGEPVSVTTAEGIASGRIFSVEVLTDSNDRIVLLNLMDQNGIKSIDISNMENLQFQDMVLQNELLSALDLISRSRVKSLRTLKLSFRGRGTRKVRLSYVRAVPLWKTSYRISLDENNIPRLEGWALVQNTGSMDWENVTLSFIAGQPNAFTMDLATPRYIYRQNKDISAAAPLGGSEYDKGYAPAAEPRASLKSAAPSVSYSESLSFAEEEYYDESYSPAPVSSQATGISAGNFYRYVVNTPVTVDARSSAMIPIITEGEVGDSLAVYDPSYGIVFKGIRLTNESDAHWAAGPVSVSEGRFYSGDALIPEMIPGANRLITYAVHGSLEVGKFIEKGPQEIESLKIVDGLLERTDKIIRNTEYRIEGEENELILIHPKELGWTLVESPELAEETDSEYRFTLKQWEKPVNITEEYIVSQQYSLVNLRIGDLNYYLQWGRLSGEMKSAFQKMASLLQHMEDLRNEIASANSRISRLERDQNRVRENMRVLESDSELYQKYSTQLSEQESEIQNVNKEITSLQENLNEANLRLREFIRELDIS